MLEIREVTKNFGELLALDGVNFTVNAGRTTGFVGANGAGKTTTMRIVMGVVTADSGDVLWDGAPVDLQRRRRIGYMPEERGLYGKMPVIEQLVFLGRLHGMDRAAARRSGEDLLERLDLADRAGEQLTNLSLGNQQRVQIAAALIHEPELLILDEPFSGLDPIAVDSMAQILQERVAAGVPVLFSSHQLDLVERMCDDVVIIDGGRIVASGDAAELRQARAENTVRLTVDDDASWVKEIPGLEVLQVAGDTAVVAIANPGDDQLLLREALARGPVRELRRTIPTLAEIFREVVG